MILDSDVLIDILRQHPSAMAWFFSAPEPLYISGVAAMEVLTGARNRSEWQTAEIFLNPLKVVWLSESGFNTALTHILPLRLIQGIGVIDALIAATAVEYNLPLATFNTKHYKDISGLQIVQPYPR